MTKQQLDIFLNCIALHSFRKVAQIMYLSPSTVARQIEALEEELGITLFLRDSHNMLLTQEGHHMMRFAVEFSANYAELMAKLSSDSPSSFHQPDFAIGCYLCDGTYDTISSLIASYPSDVFTRPVSYTFPTEGQIQQMVLDGNIQVGVDSKALLENRRDVFDMCPVSQCRYHLIVGLEHPLAEFDRIPLGQLVQRYPTWGAFLPDGDYKNEVAHKAISSAADFRSLAEFTIAHFDYIMPSVVEQRIKQGSHGDQFILIVPEVLRFLDDLSVHNVAIKGKGLVCEYMAFWRKDRYDNDIQTLTQMLRTIK